MTEITIRGAGIFGLSIAWACVQRGAVVQVVDPFGAGAGSSGGRRMYRKTGTRKRHFNWKAC